MHPMICIYALHAVNYILSATVSLKLYILKWTNCWPMDGTWATVRSWIVRGYRPICTYQRQPRRQSMLSAFQTAEAGSFWPHLSRAAWGPYASPVMTPGEEGRGILWTPQGQRTSRGVAFGVRWAGTRYIRLQSGLPGTTARPSTLGDQQRPCKTTLLNMKLVSVGYDIGHPGGAKTPLRSSLSRRLSDLRVVLGLEMVCNDKRSATLKHLMQVEWVASSTFSVRST